MLKCDCCGKDILVSNVSNISFDLRDDNKVYHQKLDLCDTCKHKLDTYMRSSLVDYIYNNVICPNKEMYYNTIYCELCEHRADCDELTDKIL